MTATAEPTPPPHDLEVEAHLLGAAMLDHRDGNAARLVADLGPEVFYRPVHVNVAGAIAELVASNAPTDEGSVAARLKAAELLDAAGGRSALVELIADCPASSSATHWAGLLRDLARRRKQLHDIVELRTAFDAGDDDRLADAASKIAAARGAVDARLGAPVLVRVADVKAERVRWLWEGRLPLGKLVIVDGDPGAGKSTLTCDWAARVTTGTPWPGGDVRPEVGNVVLCSAEDGVADTIRPRLAAAGANVDRVTMLAGVADVEGEPEPISLPYHASVIRQAVVDVGAVMLVIDPLMAFLGGDVNSYRDQDVRRALRPLVAIAEDLGVVVVVVRHLTKAPGGQAVYRGGGSIGIIGAARVGMLVAADPDDDTRRVLAVSKSNLAAFPSTLAYRLMKDDEHGCSRVQWDGTTAHTADQLVAMPESADDRSALDDACRVIADVLDKGPVLAEDAKGEITAAGVHDRTRDRAKARLKVVSFKSGGTFGGDPRWYWKLPSAEDRQPHDTEKVGDLGDLPPEQDLCDSEADDSTEVRHIQGMADFRDDGGEPPDRYAAEPGNDASAGTPWSSLDEDKS